MNKFKKGLIMALAVGVLMMGSVFGATTADFKITTNVLGITQMGIYDSDARTNAPLGETDVVTATTIFNSETGDIDQNLEGPATSATNYLTVRTNSKTTYKVLVDVPHLKNTHNTTETETLAYTMIFGKPTSPTTGTYTVPSSIASGSTGTLTQFTTKKGLRVENFPFSFSITDEDYNNASVGGYEAIITFTLMAN